MGVVLNFGAQLADVHHHRAVGNGEVGLVPNALVNGLGGENPLGPLHQQPQDLILNLGQIPLLSPHPHLVVVQGDGDALGREHVVLVGGARLALALVDAVAPQQGLHPGDELGVGEGLYQVVVPAGGKADELVRLLGLGG